MHCERHDHSHAPMYRCRLKLQVWIKSLTVVLNFLCSQGVEGKYIRLSSSSVEGLDPPEFHVDPTLGM